MRGAAKHSPATSNRLAWLAWFGRVGLVYLLCGLAFQMVVCAYLSYREAMGNPSDLPCWGIVWTPLILIGWPLDAAVLIIAGMKGAAVPVPDLPSRGLGALFLIGWLAATMWVSRAPRPKEPEAPS